MSAEHHTAKDYVKTWALLMVLFFISVMGPLFEVKVVTMITAFGVAIIKALIVARNFMHLNLEKKFIHYILLTMLLMVFLFYAGTMTDVQNHSGHNWERVTGE